ncbi:MULTISPECIES: hypothetical protein [unclassified Solwaraspora]|uniref:hypothetical protein n=1 Tax=unclassified Solwaraspora TaxID=2627926 RepID=UPI00259B5F2D|nr:hypothetical protein [Solwaraspora sp. WMMA2056]WJK43471.1 hypothetical protein O7608_14325 [Solwaraspora sp. WMMA2056]
MSESISAEQGTAVTEQPPTTKTDRERASIALVPATGAGMPPTAQTFFAVVNASGGLVRGFGVVSATRLAAGTYQVVFSHDLTGSAYIGTIGLPGSSGASAPGEITVVGRAGIPNGVFVQTFTSAGVLADRSFHLAVVS